MKFNWPELNSFCGCCKLQTGIYIVGTCSVLGNAYVTYEEIRQIVVGFRYFNVFKELIPNIAEVQYQQLGFFDQYTLTSMFTHQMAWVLYQMTLVLTSVLLLYGVYKGQPRLIKLYIFYTIPSLVFVTFCNGIDFMYYNSWKRFGACFVTLLGAYQILATRSLYRIITGKTKLVESDSVIDIIAEETADARIPTYTFSIQPVYRPTFKHCRTCLCVSPPNTEVHSSAAEIQCETNQNSSESLNAAASSPEVSDGGNQVVVNVNHKVEELNFKDEAIVFDQTQLERGHPLLEESETYAYGLNAAGNVSQRAVGRPTTLAILKRKQDIENQAIIYDENQFNVGNNSVVDDR